jgi:hypothetical protein
MITYPAGRLVGVIDDPEAARAAADALVAAGVPAGDLEVLTGTPDRGRLGRLGPPAGPWSRVVRVVQFLLMDQLPDFLVYERALEAGRAVIAVRVTDRRSMLDVAARLQGFGAHFLNHFGRFQTEEVSRWRGEELDIPGPLRR